MKFQTADQFTISEGVLTQNIDGEMVLLDMESENYFGLDEVGTRIWSLLQSGNTVTEILDLLSDEYDVSRKQLETDVAELLARLIDAGLVQVVD